jgi:8-oxo-dGTP diphosphatase
MKTNDVSSWNVLLVQRGKEPFKGCYSLPGGSIEHGEQIRDGAAREVGEETGLPISVNAVQGPALQQIPCKDWLLYVCYSFWHGEKPPVRAAGDVTEARFVRLEDLRTMHNITPGLYNTVLELAKVAAADDSK